MSFERIADFVPDALAGLMRMHGFVSSDVARIEVNTFTRATALYPRMPATTSQAQLHTMAASLGNRRAFALWAMRNRLLQSDVTYAEFADLVREPVEKPHD